MVAISGVSQPSPTLSAGTGSNKADIAALEKQIVAKETEAEENEDQLKAATLAAELATLKAELARLQAAEKKTEATQETKSEASRQAEFDKEAPSDSPGYWV